MAPIIHMRRNPIQESKIVYGEIIDPREKQQEKAKILQFNRMH